MSFRISLSQPREMISSKLRHLNTTDFDMIVLTASNSHLDLCQIKNIWWWWRANLRRLKTAKAKLELLIF